MSARYDWTRNNRLFVAGFPVAGGDAAVQTYVDLMRRTHSGLSFEELTLTAEERVEVGHVAEVEVWRHHGMVAQRDGSRLRAVFRRFGGEEYEVEKQYRAFLLGESA